MESGVEEVQGNAERILEAALHGFAHDGVRATSIRDVAKAAGVSPGLVQHHYPSKAALKEAVDKHVVSAAVVAFGVIPDFESAEDFFIEVGNQITNFVREEPLILRYVARAMVEGEEEGGLLMFDGIVALTDNHVARLHQDGHFREEIDLLWTGLHLVVFNLACILFETALDRRLPAPFKTGAMMERWNRATTELYRHGLDRPEPEK